MIEPKKQKNKSKNLTTTALKLSKDVTRTNDSTQIIEYGNKLVAKLDVEKSNTGSLSGADTSALLSLIPATDSTYTLGTSDPKYWSAVYSDTYYANNTAYISGATAGQLTFFGDMKFGTTGSEKIGFFNTAPIVKGTAFTQTYSTATHTHALQTAVNPPAGGVGATAGAYDTAANRNLMITSLTNTIADVANLKQVVNGLIDDFQALGLIP